MTDNTPTTEDVRRRWAASEFADSTGPGDWAYEHADFAPLDRWLAGVVRQAKAEAWEEGWLAEPYKRVDENPYANE